MGITRRSALIAAASSVITFAAACGAPSSPGGDSSDSSGPVPEKPKKAVTLNVLDVAGNLQLTQGMIDEFVQKNPDIISRVTYSKSPAPELAGKIKAQQSAGRVDIGLVLTGVDGLAAGIDQNLWMDLLPTYADRLPGMKDYQEPAAAMQKLAGNAGVTVTYYPSGPLLEYLPAKVSNPPTSAEQLLAYAKAHPGKVQYARPSNSGPGRTFLMGLPYILGDKDPKDPVNGWDKTWAYLKELNQYVEYYPSGTTETMKNLANGSVDVIASTTGWDINPRVLGTVPKEAKISSLQGFHWVTDAHYAVIPKGASTDTQAAVLALLKFMLTAEQQAKAFDQGYFYPGPAVKGVDLSMAPQKSQDAIKEFGRPEYDALIADNPTEVPLDAKALVAAFDRWDREIGSGKVKQG
ncbi:ABC transporter substrate-binding protein [Micromonospora globispora]|uniref:extracellular solute-binding protein n=1 Tax=Micromonospora globispora TaxID=1450148 RepID=UPI000D6FB6AA|nr:extracellular solute-binding protein [Micromonospora globispora]PWU59726.1 ABC transporter substrate-binding protein [Micromonospora globispora]RQW82358.1 ABC transporter substrate-binding protein [Micromonospora globispora]